MRKILVVGSGGREAALALRFSKEPNTIVFCAPGNAGIAVYATCIDIKTTDTGALLAFGLKEGIDLTVVGPEGPLFEGIVDTFRAAGLKICGPTAAAARTEKSKDWFKRFLVRNGFATAPFRTFTDLKEALANIKERDAKNIVIKADGPMAGKGVFLPESLSEARKILQKLMVPGSSGGTVLIEDRLIGPECSAMAATDGKITDMFPFIVDYKRAGEGGAGENTGGMGAHTIRSFDPAEKAELESIVQRIVRALALEGCWYSGFIYIGFIKTIRGWMILECNCRLGDPEAQVILSVIDGNFGDFCAALAAGDLRPVAPPKRVRHAVCVVIASPEYPEASERDDEIKGLTAASQTGAVILHAGTACKNGIFTTNKSGRILNILGIARTLAKARSIANAGARLIDAPVKFRWDIASNLR